MPGSGRPARTDQPLAWADVIRPAQPADVPALLQLIHELARYEREPDAVQNEPDRLRDVLFGANPSVYAHVAELAGEVVGCAIWFVNYSTWTGRHGIYLEDLIVSEAARGAGLGTALLSELARICRERGYRRLDWAVLDWNEPAIGFYRSLGAVGQTAWRGYRLSGAELDALADLTRPGADA